MFFSLREVCIWNPMGLPMGGVSLSGSNSVIEVGNENNTGVLEVGSLDLKGGKLVLDP